jgi:hypothetical protein
LSEVVKRAGAHRRPAHFVILAGVMLLASCYSSSYRRELLASVALVSSLSDKLADYCRADFVVDKRPLSSEEMGEFYYGLQKARAFERMSAKRRGSDASGAAFAGLVNAYEKFVTGADQYRLNPSHTQEQLEQLLKDHETVMRRGDEVRRALRTES